MRDEDAESRAEGAGAAQPQGTWKGVALIVAVGWLSLGPVAAAAWLGFRLGVHGGWVVAFVVVAFFLAGYRWLLIADEDPGRGPGWRLLGRWGLNLSAFAIVVAGLAAALRVASLRAAVLAYLLLGFAALVTLTLLFLKGPLVTMAKAFVDLAVGPVGWAWLVVSVCYLIGVTVPWGWSRWRHDDAPAVRVRGDRAARAEAWRGPPVAVTLSGGGYRAAAMHAGVLWVLDQARIPVHILSTVSGGSIIGATYALGWTPGEFRDFLAGRRPGLPGDLFNLVHLLGHLAVPWWSSGDTYEFHFYRTYFHGHTLGETCVRSAPERPCASVLIINASTYPGGRPAAFWPEKAGAERLAALVAASGAFPVAFDPVMIRGARYLDGGLVENLGLEGLGQYLREARPRPRTPGILLVSDASAEPPEARVWLKPGLAQMATQALETVYRSAQERLYRVYTGEDPENRYDRDARGPLRQPYGAAAERLWPGHVGRVAVFVLSPTSPAERSRFPDQAALVEAVASLSTLKELSRDEVDATFWLGAKLASDYVPAICQAARVAACPSIRLPRPPER